MQDSESCDITGAQFLKPQGVAKNEPDGKIFIYPVLEGQGDTALLRAAGTGLRESEMCLECWGGVTGDNRESF